MLKYYFKLWRKRAEDEKIAREYDYWCEIQEDLRNEWLFARNNGMDDCWACKYSDCERHR
jgi:hypothetical protein